MIYLASRQPGLHHNLLICASYYVESSDLDQLIVLSAYQEIGLLNPESLPDGRAFAKDRKNCIGAI